MRHMRLLTLGLLVGCGGDDATVMVDAPRAGSDSGASDKNSDSPAATFALTSPTITEGGTYPLTHVCASRSGMNLSPQLALVNVPAGTMSFAIVLTDLSNGLVHCAIYDIPATATGLPADVDKVYAPPDVAGAHQTLSHAGGRGYSGPCPSITHTYELKAYALAAATLSGATMTTTKEQVVTAVATNLGTATLTATFTP